MISNILALFRGNIMCLILKIFKWNKISYNLFLRICSDVSIRISGKSKLRLGRGVLIGSNSVCSATDGGNLYIGNMVGINRNSMIMCHELIIIGDNTIMGPGVLIYDHDHNFSPSRGVVRNEYKTSPVIIGKNCWIGAGTIILKGSILEDNCLVAAGCVIKGEYQSGSIIIQKKEELIKQK